MGDRRMTVPRTVFWLLLFVVGFGVTRGPAATAIDAEADALARTTLAPVVTWIPERPVEGHLFTLRVAPSGSGWITALISGLIRSSLSSAARVSSWGVISPRRTSPAWAVASRRASSSDMRAGYTMAYAMSPSDGLDPWSPRTLSEARK